MSKLGLSKIFSGNVYNPTEEDFKRVGEEQVRNESVVTDEVIVPIVKKEEAKAKAKSKLKKDEGSSKNGGSEILRAMVQDDFKVAISDYCLENDISENDFVIMCAKKVLERGTLSKERVADKIAGKTKSVYARVSKDFKVDFLKMCNKLGKSMGYVLSQEIAKIIQYN